jgi:hypothetical protein
MDSSLSVNPRREEGRVGEDGKGKPFLQGKEMPHSSGMDRSTSRHGDLKRPRSRRIRERGAEVMKFGLQGYQFLPMV